MVVAFQEGGGMDGKSGRGPMLLNTSGEVSGVILKETWGGPGRPWADLGGSCGFGTDEAFVGGPEDPWDVLWGPMGTPWVVSGAPGGLLEESLGVLGCSPSVFFFVFPARGQS